MKPRSARRPALAAVLCWCALAAPASPGARAQGVCPPGPPTPPAIEVVALDPDPVRDASMSPADLAALGGGGGGVAHGLTVAVPARALRLRFAETPAPGGVCLRPSGLRLEVGHRSLRVYIDRAYAPGTCQHRAVSEHEAGHVRNARETLLRSLAPLREAAEAALSAASRPVFAADPAAARARALASIEAALDAVAARADAERAALDAALDSPESYQATAERCAAW